MSATPARDISPMVTLLRWMLLLLVLGALGLVWLPADWPARVMAVERQWCLSSLGRVTGAAALEQARRWSVERAIPRSAGSEGSPSMGFGWLSDADESGWAAEWTADRLVFWDGLRELLSLRLALLAAWGPALLLLLVAFAVDGHWRWRIRQCGFDYPSPIGRQASATGMGLLVLVLGLTLGLPLPLHPGLLPLGVLLCAVLIATGIRHLPKQL